MFTFSCQCPSGTAWNGTYCVRVKVCTGGAILNTVTNQCVCPDGTYLYNGYCQATGCSGGQAWNGSACVCDQGYNWNGTVCLLCINGQVWNPVAKACLCPPTYAWNGRYCQLQPNCSGNRIYNNDYQVCVCPEGQVWNGATCIAREPCCCGQQWNDTTFQCNCAPNFNWDGKSCVYCVNGKVWDQFQKTCVCQTGSQWNGQFCAVVQNCQGGTIWNQNTWSCECPSTTVWNGYYCLANPCVGGQIWDNQLKTCVCMNNLAFVNGTCVPPKIACLNGQIWDNRDMVCRCPRDTWYNGTACVPITKCVGNQIYNPLNNQCVCPPNLVFLATKNICGDPTCPAGQRWDGQGCVALSCPPGSWFNGTDCVCPNPRDRCLPWQLWDGENCVYHQGQCPPGTKWNKKECATDPSSNCPNGYYLEGTKCTPFPQQCLPATIWSGDRCVSQSGSCPYGTVASGTTCQPYTQCTNGQSWDPSTFQCVCPKGTGWSGKECIICAGGQVWNVWDGCTCPEGYFMAGSICQKPTNNMCRLVPNAYWDSNKQLCLCNPGFSVVGYQCVCKGVEYSNFCDRCAYRPNSQFYFGICRCNAGFTLVGTQCLPNQNNGNDTPDSCSVGTFFDTQQKKCLRCPDGCLKCSDCYTCQMCSPDFNFVAASGLCEEKCNDGKRYILECDDGNLVAGDGCTNCKIDLGWTCRGGSPNSPDYCVNTKPNKVTFLVTGQIRYETKVVLNVKLDYLPPDLMQAKECNDRCSQVLVATVTQGDKPISIKSSYVAGSRFTFNL